VRAARFELETGSDNEVLDGSRHEHLAGAGERAHARADVDRDAGDVLVEQLAFAAVQPRPHVQIQRSRRLGELAGAADRARRTVEDAERSVADHLHDAAAGIGDVLVKQRFMALQQIAPGAVADTAGPLGRADEVGE
jgi:hypothetical protein